MEGYKTLIGAGVAFAAQVAALSGVDIGDSEGLTTSIITVGGAMLAIYGRVKATKKIGGGDLD